MTRRIWWQFFCPIYEHRKCIDLVLFSMVTIDDLLIGTIYLLFTCVITCLIALIGSFLGTCTLGWRECEGGREKI